MATTQGSIGASRFTATVQGLGADVFAVIHEQDAGGPSFFLFSLWLRYQKDPDAVLWPQSMAALCLKETLYFPLIVEEEVRVVG